MNEREALLANVLRVPGDDTARLVYADWLQENGEPERAEFIRVQIELAKVPPAPEHSVLREGNDEEMLRQLQAWRLKWSKTNYALRDRERELLDGMATFQEDGYTFQRRNWQLWREPWPDRGDLRAEFRRGFVESVTCTAADFMAHARDIFRAHPVTAVRLVDKRPWAGHWGLSSGEAPDVFAWWAETHSNHHNEIPWRIADHMVNDPRRLTTPQDYKPGNGVGGCIAFAHESSALDALSRVAVAYGRTLAGLPPLAPA